MSMMLQLNYMISFTQSFYYFIRQSRRNFPSVIYLIKVRTLQFTLPHGRYNNIFLIFEAAA
jgi:hypothetical protein